ncbi:hypothetical protein L1I30_07990 [Gillisia sp. M10.2A]|uniref:DUF3575 domain-containing protein n=1 Tax=Gillisia lutea TaxID=2909668 RepID=A0ABS9EFF2_9FLAO|nr:hypothetical protein [Gillisia lutea]MCF4101603.1 hypothetical protein [Gillisia lutea]
MKKLLLAVLLTSSIACFSQETTSETKTIYKRDITKNELSIGALNLVAFGALDITYERIINPNSSWAIEGFVKALNRENEDVAEAYSRDFSLTGKFKYFFSDRSAWGFYVNGLGMLSSGEYDNDDYIYVDDGNGGGYYTEIDSDKKYTDFALGFGLGGKFVSKQGFVFDLSTGIGRNLFNSDSPTIVGQFSANLGYRF